MVLNIRVFKVHLCDFFCCTGPLKPELNGIMDSHRFFVPRFRRVVCLLRDRASLLQCLYPPVICRCVGQFGLCILQEGFSLLAHGMGFLQRGLQITVFQLSDNIAGLYRLAFFHVKSGKSSGGLA